ncbi:VPS36 [Candida oxycetoniae]|uniref:Vacuolar protein-sorting-associated protein 36 n=1 Tax=Candida oxycetoniae TaxID=497107 RepID=A0AAI9SVE8_9ASCO|nr:VPS36 [Candida oxycetoniae]KAI3403627.2 VPS36 [Candida oxycetoniae]
MSWLNVWHSIRVNRSNRPILADNEYNIFIRDHVGLYQGKSKITDHQDGRLYLTNKRIIYFDNKDFRNNSIAVNIDQLSLAELIDGFLRSSPKVKLFLKSRNSNINGGGGGGDDDDDGGGGVWVCKICSFNNSIERKLDLDNDEAPKCIACGVQSNRFDIENILINARLKRENRQSPMSSKSQDQPQGTTTDTLAANGQCPMCTFINHKSIKYCEMCGTELTNFSTTLVSNVSCVLENPLNLKLESPGKEQYTDDNRPYVKVSFHKGGESKFFQEVANLIDESKWENLRLKGGINQNAKLLKPPKLTVTKSGAGIHGLEQIGEQQRKNNEIILSTSLDDLEQLMFKYQDLMKLSSSFSSLVSKSPARTMEKSIPPLSISKTSKLYHNELSRHISEYLTNFKLTKNTAMITLQDLFAEYNRYLVRCQGFACQLVDVGDFKKSVDLFETLDLPFVQNKYDQSDLVVIRPKIHADSYGEFIVLFLKEQEHQFKVNDLRSEMINEGAVDKEEIHESGCYGCTVSHISHGFKWSYTITMEELEKAVKNGQIVVDQNISGTFYYVNKFSFTQDEWNDEKGIEEIKKRILQEQNDITMSMKREYEKTKVNNLINLNPDYEFGTIVETGDSNQLDTNIDTVPIEKSPIDIKLNGLEGLKF